MYTSVADPGFPEGGADPVGGGTKVQCGNVMENKYVKKKESGRLGGHPRLDPPMHFAVHQNLRYLA